MAWEKHGDKAYYYKKQRIGGKVKPIYVGSGELAQLISGIDDAIRRAKRSTNSCKPHSSRADRTNKTEARAP